MHHVEEQQLEKPGTPQCNWLLQALCGTLQIAAG
jgi:hypothetical protein